MSHTGRSIDQLPELSLDNVTVADNFVVYDTDTGTTTRLPVSSFQTASLTNGYWFQNSGFYENGGTHDGNPDVISGVEAFGSEDDTLSRTVPNDESVLVRVTSTNPIEYGNQLPESIVNPYDTLTGAFSLTGMKATDMLQFRFAIDVEAFSDESSATLILLCQSPLGFSFTIEEQLVSMTEGAKVYEGLATVPVFVGSTLADNGTPATITPYVRLNNTDGNILPRGFVLYMWR